MTTETILEIIGTLITFGAPFITAQVTNVDARRAIKVVVCFVASTVGAAVYAAGEISTGGSPDWPALILGAFGVAQLTYFAADAAFRAATKQGLNENAIMSPDQGIGAPASPVEAE